MKEYHSCDAELYQRVKDSVSMQQAIEYCGLKMNGKGLCICPFHHDNHPSLKVYPNGKGFYCFTCGAGGDQIKFVAKYYGENNYNAAKRLATAYTVPIAEPVSYREKREAEKARERKKAIRAFALDGKLWVKMYWILLCEARRNPDSDHYFEAVHNLDYMEYVFDCLEHNPEELYSDKKAVNHIGRIKQRVRNWYRTGEAIPG